MLMGRQTMEQVKEMLMEEPNPPMVEVVAEVVEVGVVDVVEVAL